MKVLIDTNVLLDYLAKREPFYENAMQIIYLCMIEKIQGVMAAHSVMNVFYILRKDFSIDERRTLLIELSKIIDIEGISKEKIISSLSNLTFSDVEDSLQVECAKSVNADFIITRNIKDFENSPIPCILPNDFLSGHV